MTTKEITDVLKKNIAQVIKGKDDIITLFIAAYLSGGHVLIDDIPGVGKTTLVKPIAKLIQKETSAGTTPIEFKRLQCTPDLLPYDITGVDIFNAKTQSFEFLQGPVFCDILLADELNRTPPKVQSALLEVMEERQVTAGRKTYKLNSLFFTAATQNPVETIGTYPLPPAQLDRFMISFSIGYPDDSAALDILHNNPSASVLPALTPVISTQDILSSRHEQETVNVHSALEKAVIGICNETRMHTEIELGASPRSSIQLLQLAKTFALIQDRTWVEDRDLYFLAPYVLMHRCIFKNNNIGKKALIQNLTAEVLKRIDKETDWTKC